MLFATTDVVYEDVVIKHVAVHITAQEAFVLNFDQPKI